ncbi:MAG: hypothetical protein WA728_13435 [Xanthobacteraceae bacterium]
MAIAAGMGVKVAFDWQSGVSVHSGARVRTPQNIDAVFVEQRTPLLADAKVRAIELLNRRDCDLVHAHDDPIDIAITACGS